VNRLGLRTRLSIALISVAVLAVGLATILGDAGLKPRLSRTAQARLDRSAVHFAEVAAAVYAEAGSWQRAAPTLRHLAELDELRVVVRINGRNVLTTDPPGEISASAAFHLAGRVLGTVTVAPISGDLYTPEERQLRESLDRLHLITGTVAIGAALLIAFLLAQTLTRPLRRLLHTAERMERGEVDVRVDATGTAEVVALGRALNRLAETLEHEEEIRKANVADLAHELRTPVNALLARIEAAQDDVLPAPENLSAMHDEALRLTRLLDDLARLADAERPGMLLDKRAVDLAEVARTVADSFAPRFAEKGVTLSADLEPTVVLGDPGRLVQIATNLVTNALRYTEQGQVRLSVRRIGSEALLEVSDTGIGIAPGDIRHIFTRFWRGDRSRSRTTGGTGIGLSIVRELVRAHDGRIDVESTPGLGSVFRVLLPTLDPGSARRHEPASHT
jgi:two-component system, OmpR family, sensor histidine kinase BaeS